MIVVNQIIDCVWPAPRISGDSLNTMIWLFEISYYEEPRNWFIWHSPIESRHHCSPKNVCLSNFRKVCLNYMICTMWFCNFVFARIGFSYCIFSTPVHIFRVSLMNKHDTMIASPFFLHLSCFLTCFCMTSKESFWACLSFSDCFTYATVVIHVLEINNEGNFLVLCKKYDSYHHNPLPFLSLALCHLFFLLKIYQWKNCF